MKRKYVQRLQTINWMIPICYELTYTSNYCDYQLWSTELQLYHQCWVRAGLKLELPKISVAKDAH